MQGLWQSYVEQGIPETAAQVMVNAKRTSTQKQYDSYLKAWFDFCAQHQRDPFELDVPFGISFLEQLRTIWVIALLTQLVRPFLQYSSPETMFPLAKIVWSSYSCVEFIT